MPSVVEPAKPLPVYYIGHAGVGLLFDESPRNRIVQDNLRAIGEEVLALSPRPKAIITFSGHFEAGEIHGPGVIEGKFFNAVDIIVLSYLRTDRPIVNVKRGTHIQVCQKLSLLGDGNKPSLILIPTLA